MLALVLSAAACRAPRETVIEAVIESGEPVFEALWDRSELSEKEREGARLWLECMWDDLEEQGVNPRPDLRCMAKRMRAVGACLETAQDPTECSEEYDYACSVSEEFEMARRICPRSKFL